MKKTHLIWALVFAIALLLPSITHAHTVDEIKGYITKYAALYNTPVTPLMVVADCESDFRPVVKNKVDGSTGLFQFQPATFYGYAKKIKLVKPDINNPEHSAQVAAYMFSIGQARQWTTYRAYVNGGKYTFFYKHQNKYITVYCKG